MISGTELCKYQTTIFCYHTYSDSYCTHFEIHLDYILCEGLEIRFESINLFSTSRTLIEEMYLVILVSVSLIIYLCMNQIISFSKSIFPVSKRTFTLSCCFKLMSFRSSRPDVFYEKGFLKNYAKFTRKHLCWSLFLNKVAGLRPAALFKKRLWQRSLFFNELTEKERNWNLLLSRWGLIFIFCLLYSLSSSHSVAFWSTWYTFYWILCHVEAKHDNIQPGFILVIYVHLPQKCLAQKAFSWLKYEYESLRCL